MTRTPNKPFSPLLTVAQVAKLCGASERRVHRWIAADTLRSVRLGRLRRIRREDYERFVWEGSDDVI